MEARRAGTKHSCRVRSFRTRQDVSKVYINDQSDCEGPTELLNSGGHCGSTLNNLHDPNGISSCSQSSQKPNRQPGGRLGSLPCKSTNTRYGVWQILGLCGGAVKRPGHQHSVLTRGTSRASRTGA